jgi:hypothetical protein
MVVGALGLGGGIVLWLTAPKAPQGDQAEPAPTARLEASFGSFSLRGQF